MEQFWQALSQNKYIIINMRTFFGTYSKYMQLPETIAFVIKDHTPLFDPISFRWWMWPTSQKLTETHETTRLWCYTKFDSLFNSTHFYCPPPNLCSLWKTYSSKWTDLLESFPLTQDLFFLHIFSSLSACRARERLQNWKMAWNNSQTFLPSLKRRRGTKLEVDMEKWSNHYVL